MRRWLLALFALLACACVQAQTPAASSAASAGAQLAAIPPLSGPVVDATGSIDAADKQALTQQALDLQQRKGAQLQILMVGSTEPEDIFDYSQRVFDAWKLGRKGIDDAVLIVVAKDDHRVNIHTGYGLEGAIPDAIAKRVIDEYIVPKFRAGDYGGGLVDGTATLAKLIDGEQLPAPQSRHARASNGGNGLVFTLFAAFFAATIARGIFSWAPKPVRSLFTGGAAGGVAWLFSSLWPLAIGVAFFGLLFGLVKPSPSRFAGGGGWGGWGGGGFGGGGFGGGGFGGGGGWSGGGGSSGGGGASGSW